MQMPGGDFEASYMTFKWHEQCQIVSFFDDTMQQVFGALKLDSSLELKPLNQWQVKYFYHAPW